MDRPSIDAALERLLAKCGEFFSVEAIDEPDGRLRAVCEFYVRHERYVITRKATLWHTQSEEFLYVFTADDASVDTVDECVDRAWSDGLERAHVGPGHMYTYVSAIVICGACSDEAARAAARCRRSKSYMFGMRGWSELHLGLIELGSGRKVTNARGSELAKLMDTCVT